jgi:hypothetical protein
MRIAAGGWGKEHRLDRKATRSMMRWQETERSPIFQAVDLMVQISLGSVFGYGNSPILKTQKPREIGIM